MNYVIIFAVLILLIVVFGSTISSNGVRSQWYRNLILPSEQPNPILFSLVWSILYFLIFIGSVLGSQDDPNQNIFFFVSVLAILFNFLWIFTFFGINNIKLSLLILGILILLVVYQIYYSYQYSVLPPIIFFIYLLWLLFAFYLNYQIYILNPNLA